MDKLGGHRCLRLPTLWTNTVVTDVFPYPPPGYMMHLEDMRKFDECDIEEFGRLESSEKIPYSLQDNTPT